MNDEQHAAILSKVLGRTIKYRDLTVEENTKQIRALPMPLLLQDDFIALATEKRESLAARMTSDLVDILGRPAITFEQYVRDNIALFN